MKKNGLITYFSEAPILYFFKTVDSICYRVRSLLNKWITICFLLILIKQLSTHYQTNYCHAISKPIIVKTFAWNQLKRITQRLLFVALSARDPVSRSKGKRLQAFPQITKAIGKIGFRCDSGRLRTRALLKIDRWSRSDSFWGWVGVSSGSRSQFLNEGEG